jgi:hypothetical protein
MIFNKGKNHDETNISNNINNNSSILREDKPLQDPFRGRCEFQIQEKNNVSPKIISHNLQLNFNYKKEQNEQVIRNIISDNSTLDYLNGLNSPKMSIINIEENNYLPSPKKIQSPETLHQGRSPKNLQSSLLNFNEELRSNSNTHSKLKIKLDVNNINQDIIKNIQIQKQKQSYLLSKNKLENLKEKLSSEQTTLGYQSPPKEKQIKLKESSFSTNQSQCAQLMQQSQNKLVTSFLSNNVKRVENIDSKPDKNRSRSIIELNKNLRNIEKFGKVYTSEDNQIQSNPPEYKIVQFMPKRDISASSNVSNRSNSKSRYQEVIISY